eukprot:608103-Prymnesium_polylepis.1
MRMEPSRTDGALPPSNRCGNYCTSGTSGTRIERSSAMCTMRRREWTVEEAARFAARKDFE